MSELIVNGSFIRDFDGPGPWDPLDGWDLATLLNCTWVQSDGHLTTHCAQLKASAYLLQAFVVPSGTGIFSGPGGAFNYAVAFSLRHETSAVPSTNPTIAIWHQIAGGGWEVTWTWTPDDRTRQRSWERTIKPVLLMAGNHRIIITCPVGMTNNWLLDDVSIADYIPSTGSCEELSNELRKRRNDIGAVLHPVSRYKSVVNEAISLAPRSMWKEYIHEGLWTVEELRFYPLEDATPEAFAAADATPSVASRVPFYQTANVAGTTITTFTLGTPGQAFRLYINDNFTTIDFTGTNLVREEATDWTPTAGMWMDCVFDGADWQCVTHEERAYVVPGLNRADYVRRVDMEGEDGQFYPLSNWEVQDREGVLTLVLDDDPPEEDRRMRLHYILPWPALDCTNITATTGLDRTWVIAMGMTLLLTEADPTREDPRLIDRVLSVYTDQRKATEARVGKRQPASRVRFHNWND